MELIEWREIRPGEAAGVKAGLLQCLIDALGQIGGAIWFSTVSGPAMSTSPINLACGKISCVEPGGAALAAETPA